MASSARVISVFGLKTESEATRHSIDVALKPERPASAKLALQQFSIDARETDPGTPVIELNREDLNSLVSTTCLAAYLCGPSIPEEDTDTLAVDEGDLSKITLAVEKELRGFDIRTMKATDFIYRINVHTHFKRASEKGGTMMKILRSDSSGSKILIKGPYAKSVQDAVLALTNDLEQKIIMKKNMPKSFESSGLLIKPLNHRVEEKDSEEPRMPSATWTAVNLKVVDR